MTGALVENIVVDGYGSNSSAVGFLGAWVRAAALGAALLAAAAVGGRALGASQPTPPAKTNSSHGSDAALAALGKQIFSDPSLSESGRMSCATCHSPQHAYGPPNGLAVQRGGAALDRQGARAVPSLRYVLNRTPIWSQPFVASRAERIIEGEEPPRGGFGWDGRFNTLHEQAVFPLLSANEMANGNSAAVMAHLRRASYAEDFRNVFGAHVFDDANAAYKGALLALERFELDDPSFHPYTSKFDDYLEGRAELTAQELHGKALFDDPQRGNCAVCHLDRKGVDGSHPLFTDYQFEALGVPRNAEILANGNSSYFDEGACGPLRGDLVAESRYCGLFKTPTLRNVATRAVFFHNGVFHTLRDALRFYARRDTDPKLWYPSAASTATANKFDDLPSIYRGNVDVIDRPLTLHVGEAPVWSDAEIEDVIAFLRTLTDRDAQSVGVNPP
jgi:cytochrome c peroxidase